MANHRLRKSRHRSVGRFALAFAGIGAAGVLSGMNAPVAHAATPTATVTLTSFHTALADPPHRGGDRDRDNCRDERHGLDNDRFCLPQRRHIRHHHHHFGGFGGHFGGFGGHHFGDHGEHGHPGQHDGDGHGHPSGHGEHHEGPHGH